MIQSKDISFPSPHVVGQLATFHPDRPDGLTEYHAMLHVSPTLATFTAEMEALLQGYLHLLALLPHTRVVMRRIQCSDIANQIVLLQQHLHTLHIDQGALSIVGQPPLDGSKISLWVYLIDETTVEESKNFTRVTHNGYQHYWHSNLINMTGGSSNQTRKILEHYEQSLAAADMTLAEHCRRTWFYIRDVDTHYKGMVEARCANFTMQRLTPDTHYIASTGIGGQPLAVASRVQMDAFAAKGLQPSQQTYLYAPTHLNPTYQYGVTFERGVVLKYGDRHHLYISGTASINNKGEVLHAGDIVQQTHRMLENIEVLLQEGGASLADIAQAFVYLRDIADYPVVKQIMAARFPSLPISITLAPVCRPAWLVEMECIAIHPTCDTSVQPF